jgi:ribonuclease HII
MKNKNETGPKQNPAARQQESRQWEARQAELRRQTKLGEREAALGTAGYRAIAGLDEAGRGPLAGPVVAAAVILGPDWLLPGLNDSKQVSPANRLRLEAAIKAQAAAWSIGEASHEEIDQYNILEATKLAMLRAIEGLRPAPDYLLLDALRLPLDLPQEAIIKGDTRIACISAASILAKTHRDRLMEAWDRQYPVYDFRRHKGYPTAAHRQAILAEGYCPIHRQSFLGSFRQAQAGRGGKTAGA